MFIQFNLLPLPLSFVWTFFSQAEMISKFGRPLLPIHFTPTSLTIPIFQGCDWIYELTPKSKKEKKFNNTKWFLFLTFHHHKLDLNIPQKYKDLLCNSEIHKRRMYKHLLGTLYSLYNRYIYTHPPYIYCKNNPCLAMNEPRGESKTKSWKQTKSSL